MHEFRKPGRRWASVEVIYTWLLDYGWMGVYIVGGEFRSCIAVRMGSAVTRILNVG